MQCREFEIRVHELLDERQSPEADAALSHHIQQCGECRELLAALTSAVSQVERLAIPAAPMDLPERVAAELLAAARVGVADRRPSRTLWRLAAAAATAAAVWLLLGSPGRHKPPPQVDPEVVKVDAGTQGEDSHAVPVVDATALAGERLRELQEQTRESLVLAFLAVPGVGNPAGDSSPGITVGPAWGQEVSETLAPVTRSTAGALETLWQVLTPPGEDKTS